MYDTFSADYDRFVNWPARLAAELPFIEQQLQMLAQPEQDRLRLLDAACGTGMHAIALAARGHAAAGADGSSGMVERARANAKAAGASIRFEQAGFGDLTPTFGRESFDALLCLGNSLPHAISPVALSATLADFAACLRPGGLLLVQNRNFDAVLAGRQRWMEPQTYTEGDRQWLFVRFYDFQPDGLIQFNILTLQRQPGGEWQQQITTTTLRPLLERELSQALEQAGFDDLIPYGNMSPAVPFDPQSSGNLVVVARKTNRQAAQG